MYFDLWGWGDDSARMTTINRGVVVPILIWDFHCTPLRHVAKGTCLIQVQCIGNVNFYFKISKPYHVTVIFRRFTVVVIQSVGWLIRLTNKTSLLNWKATRYAYMTQELFLLNFQNYPLGSWNKLDTCLAYLFILVFLHVCHCLGYIVLHTEHVRH